MKKLKTKEIYEQMIAFTEKYLLVRGMCEMVLDQNGKYIFKYFNGNLIYRSTDNWDEGLLAKTFIEESGFEVQCEGHYKFVAMLFYNSAQVGNYPPPNIEIPAHYELMHIEFELQISAENYDKELSKIINKELPY